MPLTLHLAVAAPKPPERVAEVTLRNSSSGPLRLWRDTCSWGYEPFQLLVTDASGETTAYPRKRIAWRKNVPQSFSLAPGKPWVLKLALDPEHWEGLPATVSGGQMGLAVRVSYRVPKDQEATAAGVWTGEIKSNTMRLDTLPR